MHMFLLRLIQCGLQKYYWQVIVNLKGTFLIIGSREMSWTVNFCWPVRSKIRSRENKAADNRSQCPATMEKILFVNRPTVEMASFGGIATWLSYSVLFLYYQNLFVFLCKSWMKNHVNLLIYWQYIHTTYNSWRFHYFQQRNAPFKNQDCKWSEIIEFRRGMVKTVVKPSHL